MNGKSPLPPPAPPPSPSTPNRPAAREGWVGKQFPSNRHFAFAALAFSFAGTSLRSGASPQGDWRDVGLETYREGLQTVVVGQFTGLPNAGYAIQSSADGQEWSQLGDALETVTGKFNFVDTSAEPRRLYRAEPHLPDATESFDALFDKAAYELSEGVISLVDSAAIVYGLAAIIENLKLEEALDGTEDLLACDIIVEETNPNQFEIRFCGDSQTVNDPAAVDPIVAVFEQQQQQAGDDATAAIGAMETLQPLIQGWGNERGATENQISV